MPVCRVMSDPKSRGQNKSEKGVSFWFSCGYNAFLFSKCLLCLLSPRVCPLLCPYYYFNHNQTTHRIVFGLPFECVRFPEQVVPAADGFHPEQLRTLDRTFSCCAPLCGPQCTAGLLSGTLLLTSTAVPRLWVWLSCFFLLETECHSVAQAGLELVYPRCPG